MSARVDITANRQMRKWGLRVQLARCLWGVASPFFRFSPRPLWGWRRLILRGFGARIGADAHIYPTARITMPWNLTIGAEAAVGDHAILYALGPITIGPRATVSQYAHLCAGSHDRRDPARPLVTLPITIEEDAWICADAFVGPDVWIGAGAVLGARAVAMRDLPAGRIGFGNPMQLKETT